VDDFDDLLPGRDAREHCLSQRPLLGPVDEILGNLVIDVGFQQRHTHLAQGIGDVALSQLAVAAQVLENRLEFL